MRSAPGPALLSTAAAAAAAALAAAAFAAAAVIAAAGCSSPSPCERFAELTRRCDAHEDPATTSSICRNAFDRVGEDGYGSVDSEARARQVRWLNATLRLQAACMADAASCDDYARCRKLRAPR